MADNTSIEWTDATWNPVVGCTIVSPGCTNCYAIREAHRLGLNPKLAGKYAGLTKVVHGNPVWTGEARLHEAALLQPLTWRKPRRIFVNSMSDLFHTGLSWSDIDRVFTVMTEAHWHTYQVLTKRSLRMRTWALSSNVRYKRAQSPHIWLGVSTEDKARVAKRLPDLRATPAGVRFLSCEPLLKDLGTIDLTGIDWVIAGGESGPSARPAHPDWIRSLRDQCVSANVPFFFKQWGTFEPYRASDPHHDVFYLGRDGHTYGKPGDGAAPMIRTGGKSKAPAQLDGRTWREFPAGSAALRAAQAPLPGEAGEVAASARTEGS